MICISDISGTITTVLPEALHQGSRGVNKIVLLAPFPSSATVSVFLTLPNGMSLYPVLAEGADPDAYKMASVDVALGIQKDGVDLNAWAYPIKAPVTEYSGNLTIQFSITMADSKLIDDGDETTNEFTFVEQLTTSAVNLPISRGVPTLSPTVTEKDLNTIAAYLTAAQVAATAAKQSVEAAEDAATRAGDEAGNAAFSAYKAATSESNAATSETNAANSEKEAALWATGEYTTVDEDGNETTVTAQEGDPQYNNNSKYYANEAKKDFTAIKEQVDANSKRIESLETFNFFSTVTSRADETVIPVRSAKYAIIDFLSSNVTAVKSYGANLLNGVAGTTTSNGVTFKKLDDGGYSLSGTATGTATSPAAPSSASIYREGAWLGDGDTITVSIYGSTKGTRIRVSFLDSNNSIIGSYITLNDTTRSATINKSDYPDAEKMNIIFAITAGTIVNGTAYIMVVNGDRPVPYYQYTETAINTYTFPESITKLPDFYNDLWVVDFNEGIMYNQNGDRVSIEFAVGSNSIKVQGTGRLVFEHADNKVTIHSITYQEGNYVFE